MVEVSRIKHEYKRVKENKYDNQYIIIGKIPNNSYLTERIKIEKFQGFSHVQNIGEYFRLRGATSWTSGKQVTGLFKTNIPNIYHGNNKVGNIKQLILFVYGDNKETVTIYTYNNSFNFTKSVINDLIKDL